MPGSPALSYRAKALKPSLTLEIAARAKALQAEGRDICSLSAGEPDFDTPDFISQAAHEALNQDSPDMALQLEIPNSAPPSPTNSPGKTESPLQRRR